MDMSRPRDATTDAIERTDMETTGQLFIDGRWRDGDGTAFDSFDPATGDSLWQGRAANREDVHDAFTAARRAFDDWSDRGHGEREALLRAYAQTLEQRKDALTPLIARGGEIGKEACREKGWRE